MTNLGTPREVCEQLYREGIESADALGMDLHGALSHAGLSDEEAGDVIAYVCAEYGNCYLLPPSQRARAEGR